jgi:hypothetical protein
MISKVIIISWSLFCIYSLFSGLHNLGAKHLNNDFALVFALFFN